ncbi:Hypothetical protein CINCED_3A004269 [Cinara cedri]|uniref:Uncharacterized protein n=1 Tax=Cinara cedri TaxID=506608 RepID=A0A5E4NPN7_9HEMI|nr:Hypothetical protein CINCED_3A004269 [Cinara cedri]
MSTFPKKRPLLSGVRYWEVSVSGGFAWHAVDAEYRLAKNSGIAAIDSGFKLLTSPDDRLAVDAAFRAKETAGRRLQNPLDVAEVGQYLLDEDNGVFRKLRGYAGGSPAKATSRGHEDHLRIAPSEKE